MRACALGGSMHACVRHGRCAWACLLCGGVRREHCPAFQASDQRDPRRAVQRIHVHLQPSLPASVSPPCVSTSRMRASARERARAQLTHSRALARTTHPCSARWPLPIPHRLAPRMPHATLVIMQPHLRAGVARADQKPCARHCGSAVEAAAASGGVRAGGRRCGCLPYAARTRQRGARE